MSNIPRFGAYAAAFEKAYESDDWSALGSFFAEDAVYDTGDDVFLGGRVVGREAILAYLKVSVDSLDRRFDSRELRLDEGPVDEGNAVRILGRAIYRSAGRPDLVLELQELATFEGGVITLLEDRFADEVKERMRVYMSEHGDALGITAGS